MKNLHIHTMLYLTTAACMHTDLQKAHLYFLRSFSIYVIVQFITVLF